MESTRKIGQDKYFLKILTFWSTFVQKSTFGNWTFAQFLSFEWRNGSQNRNVLEKLSGTGPFWKFWLFGQGQESTWSKHFLFLFLFFFLIFFCSRFGPGPVSRSVKPGRSGQMGQTVVDGDVMDDVTALDACGTRARVARACSGAYGMARARAWELMEARVRCGERYGGAWQRVRHFWAWNFWVFSF